MDDIVHAETVKPGQTIILPSGTYRVDDVAVQNGIVYMATVHGVYKIATGSSVFVVGP